MPYAAHLRARNVAALLSAILPAAAFAQTSQSIRIVSYNTQDDVGTDGDSGPTPPAAIPYLVTTLEGVGQEKYVGDGVLQLPDIIALQETTSNGTTCVPIVNTLNSYYGSNIFNYSTYQATTSDGTTSGGGPNALIYNQTTMNLLASVGVGTPASGANGEFRQVVRYEFQPVADEGTTTGIFYVYDSHYKSGGAGTSADGSTDGALRNGEAQIIRNDEAANLPANAAVLYVGDYNLDGSTEAMYQTLTALKSPSGVAQGQAFDPLNPTDNYNETWEENSAYQGIMTESDTDLRYRDDLQTMTSNVYSGAPGVLDYVNNSYHAFGNNGNTSEGHSINSTSNTALNDIIGNGPLTPTQVFAAMNTSLGSDHLPVVADYSLLLGATWNATGSGSWSNSANWAVSSIAQQTGQIANFVNSISAPATVTLDHNWTVGVLNVNSQNAFTFSPGTGGTLTLNNGNSAAAINVVGSSAAISAPVSLASSATINVSNSANSLTLSGSISGAGGLTLTGAGTVSLSGSNTYVGSTAVNNGQLQINAASALSPNTSLSIGTVSTPAKVVLAAGLGTLSAQSLTISNGSLELADNTLLLNYGTKADPAAAIQSYLAAGYNGGAWNGPGITSAVVAADNASQSALIYSIGFADGADGVVSGLSSGQIEIMPTIAGDAKLAGNVVFGDFQLLAANFGSSAGWDGGNFTYGSVVNFGDFQLLAQDFGANASQLASSELASMNSFAAEYGEKLLANPSGVGYSLVAVPEPTSIGLVILGGALFARRRRN